MGLNNKTILVKHFATRFVEKKTSVECGGFWKQPVALAFKYLSVLETLYEAGDKACESYMHGVY